MPRTAARGEIMKLTVLLAQLAEPTGDVRSAA
jgi:hypothetical protein